MKIDEDLAINYYFYGWELSKDSKSFPQWFEFHYEKMSCLLGYQDQDCGVVKEKEEILAEIRKYK